MSAGSRPKPASFSARLVLASVLLLAALPDAVFASSFPTSPSSSVSSPPRVPGGAITPSDVTCIDLPAADAPDCAPHVTWQISSDDAVNAAAINDDAVAGSGGYPAACAYYAQLRYQCAKYFKLCDSSTTPPTVLPLCQRTCYYGQQFSYGGGLYCPNAWAASQFDAECQGPQYGTAPNCRDVVLATPDSKSSSSKAWKWALVGVFCGLFVVIAVWILVSWLRRKRISPEISERDVAKPFEHETSPAVLHRREQERKQSELAREARAKEARAHEAKQTRKEQQRQQRLAQQQLSRGEGDAAAGDGQGDGQGDAVTAASEGTASTDAGAATDAAAPQPHLIWIAPRPEATTASSSSSSSASVAALVASGRSVARPAPAASPNDVESGIEMTSAPFNSLVPSTQ